MVFLITLGAFFACFMTVTKNRRRAHAAKPLLVSLRQPSVSRVDTTIGLRDPARHL